MHSCCQSTTVSRCAKSEPVSTQTDLGRKTTHKNIGNLSPTNDRSTQTDLEGGWNKGAKNHPCVHPSLA